MLFTIFLNTFLVLFFFSYRILFNFLFKNYFLQKSPESFYTHHPGFIPRDVENETQTAKTQDVQESTEKILLAEGLKKTSQGHSSSMLNTCNEIAAVVI